MPTNSNSPGNDSTREHDVLSEELVHIDARRRLRSIADGPSPPVKPVNLQQEADKRKLIGLAFSGGGIRSATFNLGILQGLAGLGLLKYFDYLSTVSGGGYIGAWFTAWIQRSKCGATLGAASVEETSMPKASVRMPKALDLAPRSPFPGRRPVPTWAPIPRRRSLFF